MTVSAPKNSQNNEKIKKTVDDLMNQIKTQVDQWQVPKEHEKYLETDFENQRDYSKTKRISDSINYQTLIKELEEHITKLDQFQDLYRAIDHNRIDASKKILKSPRKLLHKEIMDWLLFPLIKKQTYFNVETISTIKTLLNEIVVIDYQNRELQSKNTSMNSEVEKLQSKNTSMNSEVEKLQSKNTSMNSEVEKLQSKNTSMNSEVEKLQSKNTSMNSEVEKLQSKNTSMNSEVEKLQSENTSMNSEVEKLQSENASTNSEVEKLQSENTSMNSEVEKLQSKNTSMNSEVEKLQSENTSMNSEVEKLQSENTSMNSEVEKLQSENTSMNSEIKTLVEEIDSLDAEHQKIKSEIEKNDLRKKLRVYFKAYLEKNPNPEELDWHVNAIQKGKMTLKEIPQHFKRLPEYNGLQLLKHGCIYTVFGTKMYLNKSDNDHSRALAVGNLWEIDESKILENYIKNGMNVVDLGANIGYYTVLFSKWVGPQGKVFAFEPDPKNFKLMLKNISANHCNNVTAEQKAVSNSSETGTLYQSIENPGAHRIIQFYAYQNDDLRKRIDIEQLTLDSYFDTKNKIDLIKMDLEGSEMMALEGMKETIENNKNMMIFAEFWPYGIEKSGYSPKDFIETLIQLGFQIFTLKDGKKENISLDYTMINDYGLFSQAKLFCEKMTENKNITK